jgi:hypothetical protein
MLSLWIAFNIKKPVPLLKNIIISTICAPLLLIPGSIGIALSYFVCAGLIYYFTDVEEEWKPCLYRSMLTVLCSHFILIGLTLYLVNN